MNSTQIVVSPEKEIEIQRRMKFEDRGRYEDLEDDNCDLDMEDFELSDEEFLVLIFDVMLFGSGPGVRESLYEE